MSKNEIQNAMEINKTAIAEAKTAIKKLNKIKTMMTEYAEEFGGCNFDEGIREVEAYIAQHEEQIAKHTAWNAKRKKQMKLIEQLEALDNE